MPSPSIVIVNWNTLGHLRRCLEAIGAHTPVSHELILVDNGSRDGSAETIRSLEGPSVKTILLPENRGFAGGSNRGILAASGDPVCLVNTDVRVTRGWLKSLERCLERRRAGLAGPCTDHSRGRQRRRPWLGRFPPPFRRSREVERLSFFCVAIRRAVLDRVGLLDERFGPGTYEDDDYCRRAREAGFTLWIDGGSWAWHDAHATFRANALDEDALREGNRGLYEAKWGKGRTEA